MIKKSIVLGAILFGTWAGPSQAQSYVGTGMAMDDNADVQESIIGRYEFNEIPISIRTELIDFNNPEFSLGITGDYMGIYGGVGITTSFSSTKETYLVDDGDSVIPHVQLGYEYPIEKTNMTIGIDSKVSLVNDNPFKISIFAGFNF